MTPDAALLELLTSWLPAQRWYGATGSAPALEIKGEWSVRYDGATGARVRTLYLLDRGADTVVLYQVPLVERSILPPGVPAIGEVDGHLVCDGPKDPDYARVLLALMQDETTLAHGGAAGHHQPGAEARTIVSTRVLSGEQSNTSIICEVEQGAPIIMKVFRALHHGDNPDVVLQSAIAATGSALVPASIGHLSGSWPDSGQPEGVAHGHLVFAQEFLPDSEDAWRVALRAAESDDDFTARARALGEATADVHATLAAAMPTREATSNDVDATLASMHSRLELALREVPTLEVCRDAILAVFAEAAEAPWGRMQRIHGDYHLGQVLSVPGRGWVLVDFEGEPLRPMTERGQLDHTLRDVAGMLRSFDYAAGSVALVGGGEAPHAWAAAARHAFVDGYISRSGVDVRDHGALLDAFEIDKALYEAVYEARNRPGWLSIPTAAIRRLADRSNIFRTPAQP
ncbi:MAG: phosphotransferase [Glaciihabitans sp.]|nr:phosphotransferase [Glaciihabitans sp.]